MTFRAIPAAPAGTGLRRDFDKAVKELLAQLVERADASDANAIVRVNPHDPTAADIPAGTGQLWRNASTGVLRLWVNDNGALRSVALS